MALFLERINECLQVEANARLKVIAIFRLMPESWIGEDQLKQVILEQIKSAAPVKNPKIDLDLKISKSRKPWMNAMVLSEWEKLKTHLDHHRPQVVTYIVKINDYSHRTRSVIAYNYQILNSNKVKLKIYQPLADRDQYLTIDLARFYHYVNDKRIAGFYILDYQPKSVPVGWWQNIFKRFFLIQFFWYLKRIFYYLFRWDKPLKAKYWSLK